MGNDKNISIIQSLLNFSIFVKLNKSKIPYTIKNNKERMYFKQISEGGEDIIIYIILFSIKTNLSV